MKKFLSLIVTLAVIFSVPVPSFAAVQDVSANVNINANGKADGCNFTADKTLTVTAGSTVNSNGVNPDAITNSKGSANAGTVTFNGKSTVTGDIGQAGNGAIKQINLSPSAINKTVTVDQGAGTGNVSVQDMAFTANFTGSEFALGDGVNLTVGNNISNTSGTDGIGVLAFSGASTVVVGGDIGGNSGTDALYRLRNDGTDNVSLTADNIYVSNGLRFANDGTFTLEDGTDVTGGDTTSADDEGTLILKGTSSISGAVGLVAGNRLHEVQGGFTGGISTFGGATNAYTATVMGTGTINFQGNFNGTTLNFLADGTVDMNTGKNITADVTTAADNSGTLSFRGASTVTGNVGASGAALKLIETGTNLTGKTVEFTGDVFAATVNFAKNGTIAIADTKNMTAAITTTTDNKGTLAGATTSVNGYLETSTFTGQIGTAAATLKEIKAGDSGKTTTFQNDIFVTTLSVRDGTVNLNGNLTGTLTFDNDGLVQVADGKNVGKVTTGTDGTGTLTFLGATTTGGNIGTVGPVTHLKAVNFNGTTNLGHSVRADTITIASTTASTVTLSSSVNMNGDLVLNGAGAVLDIGLNTLNVNGTGTYTQNAGSALRVTISGTTAGTIAADGVATVNAGDSLTMKVSGYVPNNTAVNVLTGVALGGGITAPATVVSSSAMYTFAATTNAGKDTLTVTATRANSFSGIASGTGSGAGEALDSLAASGTATGDMLNVINTLSAMGSTGEIADAIETMTPDTSSGTMQSSQAIANMFFGSVSNRLGFIRRGIAQAGLSTGDMFHGAGFWIQGLGSHVKQDARKGIEGYQANVFGTTIGADKLLTDHVRMGLAGGFGFANVDSKTAGSPGSDIDSWQGMVYGSYDSLSQNSGDEVKRGPKGGVRNPGEDSWYVDGMVGFTENNYDNRREVFLPGDSRVAKADSHGQQYSTRFETGYTFVTEKTKAFEFTPFVSLGYSYLYMNKYKEDGAGALSLRVDGEGFNQLEQGLGTKFAYPIECKKAGTFIPSVKAAWLFDYMNDRYESTATFGGGGPSFETKGAKPARNGCLIGGEIAFLNKGNMTVTGNYDLELKDEYQSHTYYGTVRFDF